MFVCCVLCLSVTHAAICYSTGNGTWTNTATWSCGSVPTCGDSVIIQAGHTISITAVNLTSCSTKFTLIIRGTLQFTAVGKLQLSCLGRIYVPAGGKIIAAPGASGSDNAVMTCGSTWWNSAAGVYDGPGCLPPNAGECATVLPVELDAFDIEQCGEKMVCIQWTTNTETNNKYFEIERSRNAIEYVAIQRVEADGNSTGRKNYSYIDSRPAGGINYYRLKQVDLDGQSLYFNAHAIVLHGKVTASYRIYPNPGTGEFWVQMKEEKGLPLKVLVRNALGVEIGDFVIRDRLADSDILVKAPVTLEPGIYIICISGPSGAPAELKHIVR